MRCAVYRGAANFITSVRIEVGRYARIPLEERICQLCQQGVESEDHYICHCSVFYEIRGRYQDYLVSFILFAFMFKIDFILICCSQRH